MMRKLIVLLCLTFSLAAMVVWQPGSWAIFIKEFIKDPFLIGATAPSSLFVSRQLASILKDHKAGARILEAGGGSGAVTALIVPYLQPGDLLDVVEINQTLCQLLKNRFKGIPQVHVHCTSILGWQPSYHYDYVISTLPFSALELTDVKSIVKHLQDLSKPSAPFSYVEYRGAAFIRRFFANQAKRTLLDAKNGFLSALRKKGGGETRTVWLSLPPAYTHRLCLNTE